MIKSETYIDENGVKHSNLVKTYSTSNLPIKQLYTNRYYEDGIAIDSYPCKFEYEEIDNSIEGENTGSIDTESLLNSVNS